MHLPENKESLHLYSDTSKFATGNVLYQIHNGKPKLIALASKRMPKATKNYSITELKLYVEVDFLWNRTVDSLKTSLDLQFCSRENQLLQLLQQNEKPT